MKITVTTADGGVYPLDVSGELPVEDLKALLTVETGMDTEEMILLHNMAPLTRDKDSLNGCGVQEGDILVVTETNRAFPPASPQQPQTQSQTSSQTGSFSTGIDWSAIQVPTTAVSGAVTTPSAPALEPINLQSPRSPGTFNPEALIQHILSNPEELIALQQRNPQLAEAFASGDINVITQAVTRHREQLMELEHERQDLEGLDPWSAEYQERLAENIRQRNVRENLETAIEFNPEIFAGNVHMLYIECRVNGIPVKALVDTGAQMTVMNMKCAERCNVMRLVDRRFASYAFGVGRQRIIGVIHLGQIQLGNDFLASSFRVLEDQSHELILGLDMLKRHQCCIDLSHNVLRVGTTGTETSFLSPSEAKDLASVYHQEEKGVIEDEDREMASALAKSEQEYKEKTGELPPESPPPRATPTFPEASIERIISAGFTRQEAIDGLQKQNGDVQKTLAMLFAKTMKF